MNLENTLNGKHVAKCDHCNYEGPVRDNEDDAYEDANSHMMEPGNVGHIARVISY